MTPRKQMVLAAKLRCPTCSSAKIMRLGHTAEGSTRMRCEACGLDFSVPTEAK